MVQENEQEKRKPKAFLGSRKSNFLDESGGLPRTFWGPNQKKRRRKKGKTA